MSSSIILNEEIDDDYEPKEEEIAEYAMFLGMSLPEDEEFLYIAREGLKAPLPEPWKPCQTKTGDIYFFNFDTGQSVWEHPCDTYYKELFIEAKSKRKSQPKKSPLQEPKERSIKPVPAFPKSVSPMSFDKKRDILTEFIQLEKEIKENKTALKSKLENELQSQLRDLSIQRDIEIKLYKEQLEKDSKKKASNISKDLENVESDEKNSFEQRLKKKIEDLKAEHNKLYENEKKKIQEKIDNEIKVFKNEAQDKKNKRLDNEKNAMEIEKKNIKKQIEEQEEILDKQKKANLRFEEDMKEEANVEDDRLKKEMMKKIEEFRKEQEYEVQRSIVSARSKKSQVTLQEKIRELKEEYKVKEEMEKRNAKRELEDELKDLYKDTNVLSPKLQSNMFEFDKNYQFDELNTKYKIKRREELFKMEQELEKKLILQKELIEKNNKDKLNMFKERPSNANFIELEQKIIELAKELSQAKEKLRITEENVFKSQNINNELKKIHESLKKSYEQKQESLPKSTKINELRRKIQEKDQKLEKIRSSTPNKLEILEAEVRNIKSRLNNPINLYGNIEKPIFNYEEKVQIPLKRTASEKRENKHKTIEDMKENIISDNEEEMLSDWRKEDSWNLSRDISPVGVDKNKGQYKRPQFPTRTWIKSRDDILRY
ncbi:hypothetical protein SteCoe_7722 [Stentor coeruleus]|uniref:WW domain-containing protein n=1 Tax=Stentor coeruleus TaxID=5963 RepID=A0A1R2CM72_9CILI|nr:hypothetical protein SteCoe_7722 [Stentor coeruleus]